MTQLLRRRALSLGAAVFVAAATLPGVAAAIDVKVVTSQKGIKAWLVEDHSNPIITISIAWKTGSIYDPKGKGGTARMVASLLTEGAGDMNAKAFQRRLEETSVSISFRTSFDRFTGNLRTLTRNKDEAFRLLRLALTQPRFDADAIERQRADMKDSLARQQRNPRYLASINFFRRAFPGHPYSRFSRGTPQSLAAITRADLAAFLRTQMARGNLYVGVVGDIKPAELRRVLDQVFGDLPVKPERQPVTTIAPKLAGGVQVIRFPIPQSVVIFGQPGIPRRHKDFIAAYLLNQVLGGGGMTSRLYTEVREKRGLAYAVYSYLQPLDFSAAYMGGVATRNEDVARTIAVIRREWKRMAEQGVSKEELEAVKKYLTGSYPLRFSTSQSVAGLLVSRQLNGFTPDYFKKRNAMVQAITLEEINRVARELLKPGKLTFVVVGNPPGKL